jgi:predicted RNA-binding protein with PUA-like domain
VASIWLFKTEPSSYAYDQLERDEKTVWDGVKNPVARKNIAAVKRGDTVLIYHTGDEKAVIGVAKRSPTATPTRSRRTRRRRSSISRRSSG